MEKWGDDWAGMRRDGRLNVMQESEGALRRRVRLWRERYQGKGDGEREVG